MTPLMGGSGDQPAMPSVPSLSPRGDQELLGLSHLKKLFSEWQKSHKKRGSASSPTSSGGGGSPEEKLYMMLPLFCKVFANVGPKVITNKFPDAEVFAQLTSRLLVTEVRRRASNQSTEEAANAIASFMEVDSGGPSSEAAAGCSGDDSGTNGWLLLSALNLLLAEGEAMAQVSPILRRHRRRYYTCLQSKTWP